MNELYLTAEQAAVELGVSVRTLYAYVSRKRIRTKAGDGTQTRFYWAEDIARVKRGERRLSPDSILVPESAITRLAEEGPIYRGRSALVMAGSASLEATAAHLWEVDETSVFGPPPSAVEARIRALHRIVRGSSVTDQAISLLPLIEHSDPTSHDLSAAGYALTGARAIRWFAAIITGAHVPSAVPLHLQLTARDSGTRSYADIVRRVLVLAADHELSPATYAVRAVANTGATPYQALIAGLAASRGRRLAGGRTYLIRQLVDSLVASERPEDIILRLFRDDQPLPGFGDGVYPHEDPRARATITALAADFSDDLRVSRLLRAMSAVQELYRLHPDFLVPLVLVEGLLGLDAKQASLGTLGRIAGWIAHAAEQYRQGHVVRIRTAYTGND